VLDQPVAASPDREQEIQSEWWFNQEMLLLSRRTPYFTPLIQQ